MSTHNGSNGSTTERWPSRNWPKRAQNCGLGTPFQRAVLVAMAIAGDFFGVCGVNSDDLAAITGWSVRAILSAQKALVELGALKVLEKGGGRSKSTRYQLTGRQVVSRILDDDLRKKTTGKADKH